MSGTLCLRPLAAQLARDVTFIGKMDPYCEFIVGKSKVKGQVCASGGINPIWEDDKPLIINITTESTMTVNLKEKKLIGSDILVGTCEVNLYDIRLKRNYVKWLPLVYQNTHAGKVLFEAVFQPDQIVTQVIQPIVQQQGYNPFNPPFQPVNTQPMQHRMSASSFPYGQGPTSAPVNQVNQNWEYMQNNQNNPNLNASQNPFAPKANEHQPLVLEHSQSAPAQYNQQQNQETLFAPPSTSNTNVELNFSQKYPSLDQQPNYQPYQPYVPPTNGVNPNALAPNTHIVNAGIIPNTVNNNNNAEQKKENQSFFGKLKAAVTKETQMLL